jgi:hypothetical protein
MDTYNKANRAYPGEVDNMIHDKGNSSFTSSKPTGTAAIALLLLASLTGIADSASADNPAPFRIAPAMYSPVTRHVEYDLDESPLAGIERKRFSSDLRIRGWQVARRLYFGQTKVANEWGLGFVYTNGNTVYGLNHRGIQVMRRF